MRWWDAMNPPWRTRSDGRLIIGGTGDWSPLFRPGKNGFVNIIASLAPLREVTEDENEWISLLADVQWVVAQVLAAKRAQDEATVAEPRYVAMLSHLAHPLTSA